MNYDSGITSSSIPGVESIVSDSASPDWAGEGGKFSGGGASGSWDGKESPAETLDADGFTAADYAAFTQVGMSDEAVKSTSYDS